MTLKLELDYFNSPTLVDWQSGLPTPVFREQFAWDMAGSLRIDVERIVVGKCRPGSLVVDFEILPPPAAAGGEAAGSEAGANATSSGGGGSGGSGGGGKMAALLANLEAQLRNPASDLFRGNLTSNADATFAPVVSRSGVCGNGVCETGESARVCSVDCPSKKPWTPPVNKGAWRYPGTFEPESVYECVFGGCEGEPEPAAFCTLEDCGTLFQQTSILCSHFFVVVVRGCGAF